jgi:isoquinoline 1-oxidoreductase
MNRRRFVGLLGGGVVILVTTRPSALFAQQANVAPEDFNAYLRIGSDGRVTIYSGKIEMGQGVMTSQAQMAAEELGVALGVVAMVLGDTDQCPWDRGTFGSLTTRTFGPALRAACAEARSVLLGLASRRLGMPKERLIVKEGVVSVAGNPSRKVSYGELAQGRRLSRIVAGETILREVAQFQVMGTSPRRLDAPEKVSGGAKYAADMRVPGMLYARILRPPAHGSKLSTLDTSAAERMPGVTVVRREDLVAVLHADPEAAGRAVEGLHAEWKTPEPKVDTESIFEYLQKNSPPAEEKTNRGDVAGARGSASQIFETTFRKGYVSHAPMEPHAALAQMKDGRMTVWASTQTPFPLRDQVATALGLDAKSVRVITPYVGGGFGGKSANGQAIEAARLAKITGKPVQVAWTRSEEFFYDTFDPAGVVKIVSGIDAAGKITLWDYEVYASGGRGTDLFYEIPNARIRVHGGVSYGREGAQESVHPFAVGPWRAPGANMNVFARESQIDIMAAALGADPLEFRLRHIQNPRMRGVLEAAASAFGWKNGFRPDGAGRGVACSTDAGSFDASMAEVKVNSSDGSVQVSRVVCAQDMGIVVNPEGAKMQIEGSVTMGLGYTFSEELRFQGGEILDTNFDSYEIPKFSAVPRIEAVLVKNDDVAPQGGGEPGIPPTGGAIANAVFNATGARLFRLPMTPARVLEAIGSTKEIAAHA